MSDQAALQRAYRLTMPALAAGADGTTNVAIMLEAGTVTSVKYVANAAVTGANTETRTVAVLNKGAAGSGTTSVASLALTNGVNIAAAVPKTITLTSTAADKVVAAGDVLQFTSTHSGSTGLADPGGFLEVTVDRTA
jgi:hypothetical protein